MSAEHDALESKRRYVESLTRSTIVGDLALEGLEVPEHLQKNEAAQPLDKQVPLQLHLHIELPVSDDGAVYDRIFESLKRHLT
jgi:hypothetical protein